MSKGIFYGVGVGPGDPQLLTLKAVEVIGRCPCIATPRTGGENTLALDIAAGAVSLEGKEILPLPFLMTHDRQALAQNHRALAELVKIRLDAGTDVAMLNLGDVSIYSTYAYLMELLDAQGYETVMIPGVPSFCAVAARLGVGLTAMHRPLHIIPAGGMPPAEALALPGTKVLMKTGKSVPALRKAADARGLTGKIRLVTNCGLPDERIFSSLAEAGDDELGYFTTMILKE